MHPKIALIGVNLDTRDTPLAGLRADGFALVAPLLPPRVLDRLVAACDSATHDESAPRSPAGIRGVLDRWPVIREFADSRSIRDLIEPILGPSAFIVRSILFDKTPETNWNVPWHQDKTICVRERREAPGFGPWSVKGERVHVQPPREVLERMVTLRVHLDDCPAENGALLVVPGSHRRGILSDAQIHAEELEPQAQVCAVEAGAALLMRPLVLHASRKSRTPSHRRVLHLEFAPGPLPHGLEWGER